MNLLRAFAKGGGDLRGSWLNWTVAGSPVSERFRDIASRLDESLAFMRPGVTSDTTPQIRETEVYTSHEALLLNYEQAMTRVDSVGGWYDCSAHMLWTGETRTWMAPMWNSCAASTIPSVARSVRA